MGSSTMSVLVKTGEAKGTDCMIDVVAGPFRVPIGFDNGRTIRADVEEWVRENHREAVGWMYEDSAYGETWNKPLPIRALPRRMGGGLPSFDEKYESNVRSVRRAVQAVMHTVHDDPKEPNDEVISLLLKLDDLSHLLTKTAYRAKPEIVQQENVLAPPSPNE